MSFIAEPTPAFSRGNEPMIDSVAGDMTLPMPIPMSTDTRITCNALDPTSSVTKLTSEIATIVSPNATTALFPNRTTQRGLRNAKIINAADCGMRIAPALSVE